MTAQTAQTIQNNDRVRVLPSAFPGSREPREVTARGRTGAAIRLELYLGPAWSGSYEVYFDDGTRVQVTGAEIEPVERAELEAG